MTEQNRNGDDLLITLLELEKLRKKAKLLLGITIAIGILGSFFGVSVVGIGLIVVAVVLFLLVTKPAMDKYKKAFKDNIVKASLDGIFTEIYYEPEQGISLDEVKASDIIELKDEFVSNDLIVAKYGKVKFKQADVVITDRSKIVGKDGIPNEVTSTCFMGRFLVFDFLKPTETPVKVLGKSFNPEGNNQSVMGALKNKLINHKEQQVFMESEKFNNSFNAFCDDAQTAFYILTPQIVEAITMLSNQYQGKIALCFRDKKMLVAISSKSDSLEPKMLSNRTIWQEKELVLKDIKVITDFIDLMSLENNTLVAASN